MLHIILFILKILGCILLALLGLLILILLIVLFVPIRYDMAGSYYDSPDIAAKITWLFGIIKAKAEFKDKQFRVKVTILWKTLFDTKKEDVSKNELPEKDEDTTVSDETVLTKTEQPIPADSAEVLSKDISPELKNEQTREVSSDLKETAEKTKLPESSSEAKKKFFTKKERIKKKTDPDDKKVPLLEKLVLFIENLLDKIEHSMDQVEEKIDQLSCKWNKIERFLHAECTQNSLKLIKNMLLSILKHILPKKVKGNIHFGLDKPSTTGRILGYASACYPLYGESIRLVPDFENKIIEGDLQIHGSIRLYIFVFWLLRAVLCKDIRKLIKYIKHLKG